MQFPTPFTVETEAYIPGAKDPFNNPIDSWESPVTQAVMGWAPPVSDEPKLAGHDRIVVDIELFAPSVFSASPKDRITISGKKYSVIGYPEGTDGNPFLWSPGKVVNLQIIEG